jgi:hypothetical protein
MLVAPAAIASASSCDITWEPYTGATLVKIKLLFVPDPISRSFRLGSARMASIAIYIHTYICTPVLLAVDSNWREWPLWLLAGGSC